MGHPHNRESDPGLDLGVRERLLGFRVLCWERISIDQPKYFIPVLNVMDTRRGEGDIQMDRQFDLYDMSSMSNRVVSQDEQGVGSQIIID